MISTVHAGSTPTTRGERRQRTRDDRVGCEPRDGETLTRRHGNVIREIDPLQDGGYLVLAVSAQRADDE